MALDGTYAGLQASIADFLNRDDLATQIPDFIRLGEAKLNRTFRLRLREGDVPLVMVPGSRFVALPAAFDEAVKLWLEWPWGREEVAALPAAEMITIGADSGARPYFWCVDGPNVAFERVADAAYPLTLRCLQGFSLAGNSATAIYVLQTWPDLYLYASLIASAPFLRDDDRLAAWGGLYAQALEEAQVHEARSRSLGPLRVDAALQRPRRFNIFAGDR